MTDEIVADSDNSIGAAVYNAFLTIEEAASKEDPFLGMSTGFYDLDVALMGLAPGEFMVIAGRPASGKTSLAESIAINVAENGEGRVLVFPLSSSPFEFTTRMLAGRTYIPTSRLRIGQLEEKEWTKLTSTIGEVSEWKLRVDDSPRHSIQSIRELVESQRELSDETAPDLVVIDYLQLLCGAARWNVEETAIQLKQMAKEFETTIIAVSTLPTASDKAIPRLPTLQDLGDYISLAHHADQVLLTHREELYVADTDKKSQIDIVIAKNRRGPMCSDEYYLDGPLGRVQSITKARGFTK